MSGFFILFFWAGGNFQRTLFSVFNRGYNPSFQCPTVKRKEKAEMSQILGHKLLLHPRCQWETPISFNCACVLKARDPMSYPLLLGWLQRTKQVLWRCFFNRNSNTLSNFSPTIICSLSPISTATWCQFL